MKQLNIKSIIIKKFNHTSSKCDNSIQTKRENILNQEFKADKPGTKWVGDITYIYTSNSGWTYLATVMDLFDLKLIGYCYSTCMTSDIAVNALKMAVSNRKIEDNIIFHSDQGSQYTSKDFELLLKNLNIKHSYSKKGYPYDNACMESFNSILKKELIYTKPFDTFYNTKLELFDFIENWYNDKRIHSSLNYVSPNQFYLNYHQNKLIYS